MHFLQLRSLQKCLSAIKARAIAQILSISAVSFSVDHLGKYVSHFLNALGTNSAFSSARVF